MFAPGFDSERLTRLCGTGVPFRPLFGPIPSCNVPGLKNSFQLRPRKTCGRPHRDSNYPDKQRSIRKKTCSVKLSSKLPCGNKCTVRLWLRPCEQKSFYQGQSSRNGAEGWSIPPKNNSTAFCISNLQGPVRHPQACHSDDGDLSLVSSAP